MEQSISKNSKIFNSHPHKEDDFDSSLPSCVEKFFNSHPHKEDDDFKRDFLYCFCFFNSHPHKEDDDEITEIAGRVYVFQLTSSQGG